MKYKFLLTYLLYLIIFSLSVFASHIMQFYFRINNNYANYIFSPINTLMNKECLYLKFSIKLKYDSQ